MMPLQRAAGAAAHHHHRVLQSSTKVISDRSSFIPAFSMMSTTTSTSSSSRGSITLPPIPTNQSRYATPEQIANAKSRIISPSNPRSRRGNNIDNRNFPRYSGLPTREESMHKLEPTTTPEGYTLYPSKTRYDTGVLPADMPFIHFRPDRVLAGGGEDEDGVHSRPKFRNPRKRASKLFHQLTTEAALRSMKSKPEVWNVPFKVGDAVELEILDDGGAANPNNKKLDLIRGVVLGRENKGLDTSIYLKDVLYGEHVERKIKLHSPMVKSLKVLEEGFVNRGKKKGKRIKRAKLYYLRDRGMEETRVSKVER